MSIKRLNDDERATYLIGLAVRRQLDQAPRDPDTRKEIESVCRWLEHWLTPVELHEVMFATGFLIDTEFAQDMDDLEAASRPARTHPPGEPDDLSF